MPSELTSDPRYEPESRKSFVSPHEFLDVFVVFLHSAPLAFPHDENFFDSSDPQQFLFLSLLPPTLKLGSIISFTTISFLGAFECTLFPVMVEIAAVVESCHIGTNRIRPYISCKIKLSHYLERQKLWEVDFLTYLYLSAGI